jgi:hypothetical protein
MSMVDCRLFMDSRLFMDRVPTVDYCQTFGHRRFEMCVCVCFLCFVHLSTISRESTSCWIIK